MKFFAQEFMKKKIILILLLAIIIGLHLYVAPASLWYNAIDPDRYYHFYVSKLYYPGHFPEVLPQPVDARWDKIFPEKEFLFHVVTGFFSFLWGDQGVIAAVIFISSALLGCLYIMAAHLSTPFIGFCAVIFPLMAGIIRYYLRLHMVRPQVLAMFWFVLMIFGVLKKKPWIILSTCVGFALSYHGLQVPLIVGISLILAGILTRSTFARPLSSGAIGIVIGVLLNPYFPASVYATVQHIKIAISGLEKRGFIFGSELYPLSSDEFLFRSVFFIGLISLSLIHMRPEWLSSFSWKKYKNQNLEKTPEHSTYDFQLVFITLVTAFFVAAAAKTPRAFEYAGPSATFLMVILLINPFWQKIRYPLLAAMGILVGISIYHQKNAFFLFKNPEEITSDNEFINNHSRALSRLPPSSQGKKILNIDWELGSYIIYLRPDMKFTSLLDPTFLYNAQPHLHKSLNEIISNHVPDVFSFIKAEFGADFVYTINPHLASDLELNPHLVRLYPRTTEDFLTNPLRISLFALSDSVRTEFVSSFQYKLSDLGFPPKPWPQVISYGALTQKWPEDPTWKELTYPPRFVDFRRISNKKITASNNTFAMNPIKKNEGTSTARDEINTFSTNSDQDTSENGASNKGPFSSHICSEIAPSPEEVARLAGSEYVGIGGGPFIKIFRNHKLIETIVNENNNYQLLSRLVALPSPVNPQDEFRILICSKYNQSMGLSISFWRQSALEELCTQRKNLDLEKILPWVEGSLYSQDTPSLECFGRVTKALSSDSSVHSVSVY
jgi:hypothetical protein